MVDTVDYNEFQQRIQYHFQDQGVLILALTLPGVAHRHPEGNSRLAHMGMEVAHLVLLRRWYPTGSEKSTAPSQTILLHEVTFFENRSRDS